VRAAMASGRSSPVRRSSTGYTLIEILITLAIVGLLAAIAVPNYLRYQARAKQSEAKTNLRGIFAGQKSFLGERDAYSPHVADIGFHPERGNRYAYRLSPGCTNPEVRTGAPVANASPTTIDCIQVDTGRFTGSAPAPATAGGVPVWQPPANNPSVPADLSDSVSQIANCPMCSFSASAAGNVDSDATIDTWFISSVDATVGGGVCWEATPAGGNNAAGQPFNLNNDVGC
jgi:prepilin-type N-terminal cleavage/methylation domain-containing protein